MLFVIIGDTDVMCGGSSMPTRVVVRVLGICVAAALAVGFAAARAGVATPPAQVHLASYVDRGTNLGGRPAPDFTLQDQFGRTVSLSDWRGKVVVLAFVDDHCTTICPLTTQSMELALRLLGPAAARVELLGVDANPQFASVADVRAYSMQHDLVRNWDFLTGSPNALKAVWSKYGIAVQITKGQIDHTPALYVIDRQGRERRIYLTASQYAGVDQEAYVLAREVASLLPGEVRVAPPTGDVAAVSPHRAASLPLASGGQLAIGPGHPRLYLFLDAWAPAVAQQLPLAARYEGIAKAQGLTPLVLVDVRDAEPTPTALPQLLQSLPGTASLPLAIDQLGRVADGYGVADIPWYALTDRSGKVVWSHDGWLAPSALAEAVRKAGS